MTVREYKGLRQGDLLLFIGRRRGFTFGWTYRAYLGTDAVYVEDDDMNMVPVDEGLRRMLELPGKVSGIVLITLVILMGMITILTDLY